MRVPARALPTPSEGPHPKSLSFSPGISSTVLRLAGPLLDCYYTLCITTNYTTNMERFPTPEEFPQQKVLEDVIKWRDLPLGVYKINSGKSVDTKFGESVLMGLEDKQGKYFSVWAPSNLVKAQGPSKSRST